MSHEGRIDVAAYDAMLRLQAAASFARESRLLDCAAFAGARTILDLGCGNGAYVALLARAFPDKRFVGIDPNRALLAAGKARGLPANVALIEGTVDELDDRMSIDFLIVRLVTPHLRDPRRIADWAYARVPDALVIDPNDAAFSIRPAAPHPAFVTDAHARAGPGRMHDTEVRTSGPWERAGFVAEDKQEIVVQIGPGGPELLLHQFMVLSAQLALGARPADDLLADIEHWCQDEASTLRYGLRATRFTRP